MGRDAISQNPETAFTHSLASLDHISLFEILDIHEDEFQLFASHEKEYRINESNLENPDWTITVSNLMVINIEGNQDITFSLEFRREWESHIVHFFLPSSILCVSSMASLYINHDMLPARMSLSVTTCLAMVTLVVGAK